MLYNAHDFNGKTDKQFMPQEVIRFTPGRLGLPQANLSLVEPTTLVYLGRQHWKSDSCDRYAWLQLEEWSLW